MASFATFEAFLAAGAFLDLAGFFPRTLPVILAFPKLDFEAFTLRFVALDLAEGRLLETFLALTFLSKTARPLANFFRLRDDFALVDFFARLTLEAVFFLAEAFFAATDFLAPLALDLFLELALTTSLRFLDLVLEVEVLDFARLAFVLFDLEIDFTTFFALALETDLEVFLALAFGFFFALTAITLPPQLI